MLTYRFGGLDVKPETLRNFFGVDFVVCSESDIVFIYAKEFAGGHVKVAEAFGLGVYNDASKEFVAQEGKRMAGGGALGFDDGELTLKYHSAHFDAIPTEAAQQFGEVLKPELKKMGIQVDRISACTSGKLATFWLEQGYQ